MSEAIDLLARADLLRAADLAFFGFHTAFIAFVLGGWWPARARRVHLVALILVAISWFGCGLFYGWGYCFLTDWHFSILGRLGQADLPHSYTKYLFDRVTGLDSPPPLVDLCTVLGYVFGIAGQATVRIAAFRQHE